MARGGKQKPRKKGKGKRQPGKDDAQPRALELRAFRKDLNAKLAEVDRHRVAFEQIVAEDDLSAEGKAKAAEFERDLIAKEDELAQARRKLARLELEAAA